MKIYITTYQVPFNQIVESVTEFSNDANGDKAALDHINAACAAWWQAHDGDRCVAEDPDAEQEPYEAFNCLNYALAQVQLWGGENSFTAMCDKADLEGIMQRFYGADETKWPGYLRNAMGQDTSAEVEEVLKFYAKKN